VDFVVEQATLKLAQGTSKAVCHLKAVIGHLSKQESFPAKYNTRVACPTNKLEFKTIYALRQY